MVHDSITLIAYARKCEFDWVCNFSLGLGWVNLGAQQQDEPLSEDAQKLDLPEAPGSIPVFYAPPAKERAIRFQKSLEAASSWYEKQLHVHVPMALALLDEEMSRKFDGELYTSPHCVLGREGPGFVVIPYHTQGQPLSGAATQPSDGRDSDHAPGGILESEHSLFHEAGHLFANALKIKSGNQFVNELIPGMFLAAYIGAERPDLNWVFHRAGPASPRYTSLADLDYSGGNVGTQNYYWFQARLERLSDFFVKDQGFPSVIEKLQAAFPAAKARQETLVEIDAHLESIRPGFIKMAGPLAGPATITFEFCQLHARSRRRETTRFIPSQSKTIRLTLLSLRLHGGNSLKFHSIRGIRINSPWAPL